MTSSREVGTTGTMTAVETGGRFTRADFEKLPEHPGESRYRYELLDGAIGVTPAPSA